MLKYDFCGLIYILVAVILCSSIGIGCRPGGRGGDTEGEGEITEGEGGDLYYQDDGVIQTDQYPPFIKKHLVYGITLAGKNHISECFMLNIAETIKEMFPQGGSIDTELQKTLIADMIKDKVLIGVTKPDFWVTRTPEERQQWDFLTRNYGIYDLIQQKTAGPSQVNEVVEHILHHVSNGGLRYTFPDKWGVSKTSDVYFAMQEAIEKGHYNVAQYDEKDDHYLRIIISEFTYWVIFTGWDLYEDYGPTAEWTGIKNPTDLQNKLPLAWKLFQDTIPKVMAAPGSTIEPFMTPFTWGVVTTDVVPDIGLMEGGEKVGVLGDFGMIESIEAAADLYVVKFGDVVADFRVDDVLDVVAASGSLHVTAPPQAFTEDTVVNVSVSERLCPDNSAVLEGAYTYGKQGPETHFKPTFKPMTLSEYRASYPHLEGLYCGIETFYDTFIYAYGVTVAAMPNTPIPDIIHAAKVYAQLMDANEDYIPDDMKIYDYHQRNEPEDRNIIIALVDNKGFDNAWVGYEPCQPYWTDQALRPDHSGVGHSRNGEFDIAVEELFHKFSHAWQTVYPDDFGRPEENARSSTLTEAMDLARGIDRNVTPVDCEDGEEGCENGRRWIYPEDAWYTYNDTSCSWGCNVDEYFYTIWATWIRYNEMLDGWCEGQYSGWKPCTREEFEAMDVAAFDLLNNRGYALPNAIPYGEYGGNDVEYHGYEVEVRSTDSGDRFFVNSIQDKAFTFKRGNTYYFDQSLESNEGHEFRFSTTSDGTHDGGFEYTDGVTTRHTAGERGSYTRIKVSEDAPDTLYCYCTNNAGLAGSSVITVVN